METLAALAEVPACGMQTAMLRQSASVRNRRRQQSLMISRSATVADCRHVTDHGSAAPSVSLGPAAAADLVMYTRWRFHTE